MPDWNTQYLNRLTVYNIYSQKYQKAPKKDWYGDDGIIAKILKDTGIIHKTTIIDVLEKTIKFGESAFYRKEREFKGDYLIPIGSLYEQAVADFLKMDMVQHIHICV